MTQPVSVERAYRGQSSEQRRVARRQQLLNAGLDVFGTVGWEATTVRAVCQHAGLTPRYFYESFDDRDGLLVAVFDAVMDEVAQEVVAAAPTDVPEVLRATIGAFIRVSADDPRKGRVAFQEALGSDALMKRRLRTMRWFAEQVANQSYADAGETPRRVPSVHTASLIAAGGLIEAMIAWLDGSLDCTAQRLTDDYTKLCVAALQAAVEAAR